MDNNLGLMERFANPELFESLTFGEKMLGGGVTLIMGLGITFIVLMLLWGCIAVMGKILKTGAPKKEAAPAAAAAPVAAAAAPAPAEAAPAAAEGIDPAIIAVIMAAIAAAEGPEAASGLVVRRIQRIPGSRPAWRTAGVNEALDSRRM